MKLNLGIILLAAASICSCQSSKVKVTVENESAVPRTQATIELSADSVLSRVGSSYCYITDAAGKEIPSQVTHDGKLIFQADIPAGATVEFSVHPSDTLRIYPQLTSGRLYPERADDMAWENEVNGYRLYGPTTQNRGERAYGYDLFFKHKTPDQVLEKLYAPETSAANWQAIDSVRKTDPARANAMRDSISYHIDHGMGMDCYAVGQTLGAGVAAPVIGDSIVFQWCYQTAEVLDNGPLRFSARLDFAPKAVGADSTLTEHRLITLDAGSYLNNAKVWFTGQTAPLEMAMGIPLRDSVPPLAEPVYVAYSDPTQGADNGRALIGVVKPSGFARNANASGHILGISPLQPSDTLSYYWGFAWNREDIKDLKSWSEYLEAFAEAEKAPLKVKY